MALHAKLAAFVLRNESRLSETDPRSLLQGFALKRIDTDHEVVPAICSEADLRASAQETSAPQTDRTRN